MRFRFYGCKDDAHTRDIVSMAVKMTHPAQPGLVSVIVKHRVKKSPVSVIVKHRVKKSPVGC